MKSNTFLYGGALRREVTFKDLEHGEAFLMSDYTRTLSPGAQMDGVLIKTAQIYHSHDVANGVVGLQAFEFSSGRVCSMSPDTPVIALRLDVTVTCQQQNLPRRG